MRDAGLSAVGEVGDIVPEGPDPDEVRAQLERILASREFGLPDRGRDFLRYIVEEALAGRAGRIKAYSVAVEVFGRDSSFDAQNDPIVRIEAGRLRRALERYYLVAGPGDAVRIEIPKGAYVPVFARSAAPADGEIAPAADAEPAAPALPDRPQPAAPARRWPLSVALAAGALACLLGAVYWVADVDAPPAGPQAVPASLLPDGPSLVVRPFANLGGDAETGLYAAGLTEEVIDQLARFKELTVLGSETSRMLPQEGDPSELSLGLGVRYLLEGGVRVAGDRLRVTARVVETQTATVLWSNAYEEDLRSGDVVDIEVDIAGKVASAVAQPYGIIFRADERHAGQRPPDDLDAYRCALRFYGYRAVLGAEPHDAVRDCLEHTVARFPGYATAWAMLSFVYLDEDRFEFNPRPDAAPAGERALAAARQAVRLDPENVRALQALMSALFFTGDPVESLRVGEQALALNPNDTELLGEFGSRLAQAGDWQRGSEFLEQALARNPGHSGYYAGVLALSAFMLGDTDRAVTLIRRADLDKFPLFHVVAALIFTAGGHPDDAAASRERFLEMRPHFFENLDAELDKRNFRDEDRAVLIAAARNAGFPVE